MAEEVTQTNQDEADTAKEKEGKAEKAENVQGQQLSGQETKPNEVDISALQSEIAQLKKENASAKLTQKATVEAVKLGVDINTVQYILKLLDWSAITDESKVQPAILKVLEDVPQFKSAKKNSGFTKIGADIDNNKGNADETAKLRKMFGLK